MPSPPPQPYVDTSKNDAPFSATNNNCVETRQTRPAVVATSASPADESPSYFSKEYWMGLFDHQRLERLQQCQTLSKILQQCERDHHQKDNSSNKTDDPPPRGPTLDEIGPGLRMLKYYDWRDRVAVNQPGCIPERHSVWTCRAVALGCGQPLAALKRCFDEQPMQDVLAQPRTAYEQGKPKKGTNNIPCAEFQRAVGQCVAEQATRLEQSQRKLNNRS